MAFGDYDLVFTGGSASVCEGKPLVVSLYRAPDVLTARLPAGARVLVDRIVRSAEDVEEHLDNFRGDDALHSALRESLPWVSRRFFSVGVALDSIHLMGWFYAEGTCIDLALTFMIGRNSTDIVLSQDGSCLVLNRDCEIKLLRKADGRMVIYATQPFSGSLPDETKDLLRKLVGIEKPLGEPLFAGYERALAELAKLADATDLPEARVVNELPIFGKALALIEL